MSFNQNSHCRLLFVTDRLYMNKRLCFKMLLREWNHNKENKVPVFVCLPACFVLYPPCFQDGRFFHQEYFQVRLRRFPFTNLHKIAVTHKTYFKPVMTVEKGIHFKSVVMETMRNYGYVVHFTDIRGLDQYHIMFGVFNSDSDTKRPRSHLFRFLVWHSFNVLYLTKNI